MTPFPCPCCKATNDAATCRRCKADLAPLIAILHRREAVVARAAAAIRAGDPSALNLLAEAASLRGGPDLRPLRAAAHLAAGDFAAAVALYHTATAAAPPR